MTRTRVQIAARGMSEALEPLYGDEDPGDLMAALAGLLAAVALYADDPRRMLDDIALLALATLEEELGC